MNATRFPRILNTFLLIVLITIPCLGFTQENSSDALAQKMQNPLSSLVAIPVLHSVGFESSQNKQASYGVSIQPIFPFKFEKFNIINRIIFGYGYVPGIVEGTQLIPQGAPEDGQVNGKWGLSDFNYSFYLSPTTTRKVAWGVGPSVNIPTATDNRLGTGKWSIGPSIVVVLQSGKWTFDMVFRQTWSVGGEMERKDVNQFVAQPLVAYRLGKGYVISTYPTITANWEFENGQNWTIPLGGGLSKVLFLGKLPISLALQYYYNIVRPDLAPTSELRFTSTFILSK